MNTPKNKQNTPLIILIIIAALMFIINSTCSRIAWSYIPEQFMYEKQVYYLFDVEYINITVPSKFFGLLALSNISMIVFIVSSILIITGRKVNTKIFILTPPIISLFCSLIVMVLSFTVKIHMVVDTNSVRNFDGFPITLSGFESISKIYIGPIVYVCGILLNSILIALNYTFKNSFEQKETPKTQFHEDIDYEPLMNN